MDFGNATRDGKSNFFFPREQMSHPLGNIHVQSKMRRSCPTDWTWQWAPLTQPRTGFLKPGQLPSARLPNHLCLEGPVSLSLLSLCHCRQVLWTAVVADMWVQTIFGCSAPHSSEQHWMDTRIKIPGLGHLVMFVRLCRERIFLIR